MVGIIRTLGGGNGSNMVDQRVGDAYWVVNEVYKNLAELKQISEGFNEFDVNAAAAIAAKNSAKADAIQTAADRVQTAADRVQTALDVIATTTQVVIATTQAGLATTNGEAQVDLAEAQVALATAKAVLTAADRVQTGLDVIATAADRVQTGLDAVATAASRDAALLSRGLWQTTAQGIGNGVAGTASLVAGSGGTNGTFALAFSGGTQVIAPEGYFVVAGGSVTQVVITYAGHYSAGVPTLSFAASAGLTGASATSVMGANTPIGQYFSVPVTGSNDSLILYKVTTGPAATEITRYPSSQKFNFLDTSASSDYAFSIEDSNGRVALGLTKSGALRTDSVETTTITTKTVTSEKVATTLIESSDEADDGDYAVSVQDSLGRVAIGVYKDGRVTVASSGGGANGGIFEIPLGTPITGINALIKEHRLVRFEYGNYILPSPLILPSNCYVDLNRSTLLLASEANCYVVQNENMTSGDDNIVLTNGTINGNRSGQTRYYNGNFRTGYFGFGICLSSVGHFGLTSLRVVDTNAWGIAYMLCGTAVVHDIEFDQASANGNNGDGVTGVAKISYISKISGYTNDDMVACSVGKGTLGGNDMGITEAESIDVDLLSIKDVRGSSKGGLASHVGIGIYSTYGKTIKKIEIDGLHGEFNFYTYRIQNYWPGDGQSYMDSISIKNVDASATSEYGAIIDVTRIRSLSLEDARGKTTGKSQALLRLTNSGVDRLKLTRVQNTSGAVAGTVLVSAATSTSRPVKSIVIRDSELYRADPGTVNSLVGLQWSGSPPEVVISSFDNYVEGQEGSSGSLPLAGLVSSNAPTSGRVVANGSQLVSDSPALAGTWVIVQTPKVMASGGAIRFQGVIKGGAVTIGATLLTVALPFRPKVTQSFRMYSINGVADAWLVVAMDTGGSLKVTSAGTVSTSDEFSLTNINYSLVG